MMMMMNMPFSPFKPRPSPRMSSLPSGHMDTNGSVSLDQCHKNNKVIFVLGTTASGKSRLSIDLASRFNGEVINSDCMQVYKGLDIVTNKATLEDQRGIPHHLLGIADPDEEFTTEDFVFHASRASEDIVRRGKLPIIVGGSNYWIKALANDDAKFRGMHECCFMWISVSQPVLHVSMANRVDRMVARGLVEEGREFFDPKGNYARGVRRSIGVSEMHYYYKNESIASEYAKAKLLEKAIEEIKSNTIKLGLYQLDNIMRLKELLMWKVHHLDATVVNLKTGDEAAEAWERLVLGPGTHIVNAFLQGDAC